MPSIQSPQLLHFHSLVQLTYPLHHKNVFKLVNQNSSMNKWLEILIGLIFVIVPIYVWAMNYYGFGTAALEFLKGGIVWFVIMIGLLFLMLGISDLKN
ncbi:hypothetical protein CMI46_01710 [Candidatus Pacearchaeota archaeon]|nr:hypothetical protein [Candidatus Pacearchaeota archaeon]|tara:strand:- start:7830 stop:8123 length:294 start_codon:yes stop_codon:yes gene_type:complete